MATATADSYTASSGGTIAGGRTSDAPVWTPAAGSSATIGYAQGAHPFGLMATAEELAPRHQSWGAGTNAPWDGTGNVGPYIWNSYQAFSGGAWDQTGRRFIEYGGGHQCICVPAPTAYTLSTRAYSWLATPLPTDGLGSQNPPSQANTAAAYGDAWSATESTWQGSSAQWGAAAQSGIIAPEIGHSQYGLVWIPGAQAGNTGGIVLNCCGPTGHFGGAVDLRQRTYFDLDDNKWKLTTNFQRSDYGYYAGAACWFGGSVNRAFALQWGSSTQKTAIQNFNASTKTWSETNATAAIDVVYGDGGLIAHVAGGLLIYFVPSTSAGDLTITGAGVGAVQFRMQAVSAAAVVAGSHTWQLLAYTNAGGTWPLGKLDTGGGVFRENFETIGACYCPDNGKIYITDWRYNTTTLWVITPPVGATTTAQYLAGTWAITTETFAGGIPNKSYVGNINEGSWNPYNRLSYDTLSRCLIGVPNYNLQAPFAIKPAGL